MTREDHIAPTIEALELSLLRSPTRSDPDHLEKLLDDEMIEFGKSGRVYGKRSTIEALTAEGARSAPTDGLVMLDAKATILSDEAMLLTYRLEPGAASSGLVTASLRSSIWRHRGGRWRLLFHQGTAAAATAAAKPRM